MYRHQNGTRNAENWILGIPRFRGDDVTQKIAAPTKIQIGPTNFKNMQKNNV